MYAESLVPIKVVLATLLAVKNGSLSPTSLKFQKVIDTFYILDREADRNAGEDSSA